MSHNSPRHRIKERRPAAARLELVSCFVERRIAGGTIVGALGRKVFIVLAGEGGFCALLADDAELLCDTLANLSHGGGARTHQARAPLATPDRTFAPGMSCFWTRMKN